MYTLLGKKEVCEYVCVGGQQVGERVEAMPYEVVSSWLRGMEGGGGGLVSPQVLQSLESGPGGSIDLLSLIRASAEGVRRQQGEDAAAKILLGLAVEGWGVQGRRLLADDPINSLETYVSIGGGHAIVYMRALARMLRYFVVVCTADFGCEDSQRVQATQWDLHCLTQTALLCTLGAPLPPTPLPPQMRTVEMVSLYISVCRQFCSFCQLMGLPEDYVPPPSKLFSGRVFTHLHSSTRQGLELRRRLMRVGGDKCAMALQGAAFAIFEEPGAGLPRGVWPGAWTFRANIFL